MQSPSAPIFQSLLQAESFGRRHRVEDAGVLCTRVDLVSKVVIKTNDFAGDGTTTASVLPCKIISLGCIVPPLNPVSIKKGIKNAQGLAKSLIRNLTCQLSRDVGISKPKPLPLSAGNDKFAGDMITDIINKEFGATEHGTWVARPGLSGVFIPSGMKVMKRFGKFSKRITGQVLAEDQLNQVSIHQIYDEKDCHSNIEVLLE